MKKIFIIFVLAISLFVPTFAKEKGDSLLNFINSLYSGKIAYTKETFKKQGFITTSALESGYETIWNNQIVSIIFFDDEKCSNFFFSQVPPVSVDVNNPYQNNNVTPDRYKYLSDWQQFINYFMENYKLISSSNNVYRFKTFKIVNNPDDCTFFIMDYGLDD